MTPYEQGYLAGLEKVAVSPAMAERALTNAVNKLVAGGAPRGASIDLIRKYPLTRLRSSGVPREQMLEMGDLARKRTNLLKSLID